MPTISTKKLSAYAGSVVEILQEIDAFKQTQKKAVDKEAAGIDAAAEAAKKLLDSLKKMKKDTKGCPPSVTKVIDAIDDEEDMLVLAGIKAGFRSVDKLLKPIESFLSDKHNQKNR